MFLNWVQVSSPEMKPVSCFSFGADEPGAEDPGA